AHRRAGEAGKRRRRRQRGGERAERGEIEFRVAPLQDLHRLEAVAFKSMNEFGVERFAAPGGAKAAVTGGAAGTAGDLGGFGRVEPAELVAVKLAVGGEGDVIDVEVEAHADGVGGDKIVYVAGLVELDLGVAGARRQ